MKKLLLLGLVFISFQLTAQDLKSTTDEGSSIAKVANPLVENYISDQLNLLSHKFKLNETQKEQVNTLLQETLEGENYKSILGDGKTSTTLTTDKKMRLSEAFKNDKAYKEGLMRILNDEQKKKLK